MADRELARARSGALVAKAGGMVTGLLAFAAVCAATACVMAFRRPRAVAAEAHYQWPLAPRATPRHANFAPPPVTMQQPALLPAIVPQIDRGVLAALLAAGARRVPEIATPPRLARGSLPPAVDDVADEAPTELATDLDESAETLRGSDLDTPTIRPAQDLDDSAETRADMLPVN